MGRTVEITKVYIAAQELDFAWHERELKIVRDLWERGYHLATMAKRLRRDAMEVLILLDDLLRKKQIEERQGKYEGVRA